MAEPVIVTDRLTRRFGRIVAVDGVSFSVFRGEIFGLLGPNGAGKSTLVKLMTGQLEATSGTCVVLGSDPFRDPLAVKRKIGIVPEIESLPSFLTGREYLHFVGLVRDIKDIKKRTEEWIERLEMQEIATMPCKDLSKGTRQKLMVAAALIHEPPLVFLDEPFQGLDPRYQKLIREYLEEYIDRGGTVFMCTHILEIAEKMCTRIAIINRGRFVTVGTPENIRREGETLADTFLRLIEKGV